MQTNKQIGSVITIALVVAMGGITYSACGNSSLRATALDVEILKRTEAQLEILKANFSQTAQPIVTERTNVLERVCGANKISVDKCYVDYKTGEVKDVTVAQEAEKAKAAEVEKAKSSKK